MSRHAERAVAYALLLAAKVILLTPAAARLQHVQRAGDIHLVKKPRLGNGSRDGSERALVQHELAAFGHAGEQWLIEDRSFDQFHVRHANEIFTMTSGKVVERGDFRAEFGQRSAKGATR